MEGVVEVFQKWMPFGASHLWNKKQISMGHLPKVLRKDSVVLICFHADSKRYWVPWATLHSVAHFVLQPHQYFSPMVQSQVTIRNLTNGPCFTAPMEVPWLLSLLRSPLYLFSIQTVNCKPIPLPFCALKVLVVSSTTPSTIREAWLNSLWEQELHSIHCLSKYMFIKVLLNS